MDQHVNHPKHHPVTRFLLLALLVILMTGLASVSAQAAAAPFSVEWSGSVDFGGNVALHFDNTLSHTDFLSGSTGLYSGNASGTASVGRLSGGVSGSDCCNLGETLTLRYFDTIRVIGPGPFSEVIISFTPGLEVTVSGPASAAANGDLQFNTFGLEGGVAAGSNVSADLFVGLSGSSTNLHPQFSRTLHNGDTFNVSEQLSLSANSGGVVDARHTGLLFLDVLTPGASLVSISGYDYSTPALAAVPEPESYTMLLAGIGLLSFVARRRNQKTA